MIHSIFPAAFLSGRHAWRFWLPLLLVAARTSLAAGMPVQDGHAAMSQGVAQVVLGIISYARWPSAPAVVNLCVMGDTAYADDLLAAQPAQPGKGVNVRRIGVADLGAGLPAAGSTQPGLTQPGLTQPGLTQPGSTQPGSTQPGMPDPGMPDPGSPDRCQALYLGALPPAQRALVAERISGQPVVSISENDPDCAVGSMFCLDVQPLHVGFRVNLDAIARSGVRIHPSVLQLARPRPSP